MLDARLLFIAILMAPLLGGITLGGGCADDDRARLRFADASQGCGAAEDHLQRPLALGAELAIDVSRDGAPATLIRVTSEDAGVAEVVSVPDLAVPRDPGRDRGRVVVRGVSPGTSRLDVVDALLQDASLELSVAAVASSELRPDDLAIWNLDRELATPHPDAPAQLLSGGVLLLPDGRLRLSVTQRDAAGTPLLGHGAAEIDAQPPGLVTLTHPEALSDDVDVVNAGVDGVATITAVGGGALDVTLGTSVESPRLAVYLPSQGVTVDQLTLQANRVVTVVLLAFDDVDRLVLGSGPDGFTAETLSADPDAARLIDPPWAAPRGEVELDEDGLAFLTQARVVHVEGVSAGTTTLRLTTLGATLDLPVVVTP